VTVHLTANDAGSGVNVTEYSVDGGSYTVGNTVTIPAPADGSNDGAHTIAYFSADNAGNVEQVKSATVLIDATPPACPSCTAADYLRGTVTLSASPADGGAGIKSVEFQYADHGTTIWTTIGTDITGPAPYTADWDTTAVPDGHYDLQILVTDNADNTTVTTLSDKVVDNTNPNVAVVGSPTQGAVVSGNVGITASAADVTSPIASVQFLVNGSLTDTDTTAPYSTTWNSASGPDGAATIQVVVTDMAGNSTTSAVRTITVDNRSPVPTLDDPGANLSGTVTLTASSDPDTVSVDFQRAPAGSGTWTTIATDTSAPFSAPLDTTTLADGLYDFRVVATDGIGNTGTSAVRANRRVDNTPPSGSLTAPTAGATVGGTAVPLKASTSDSGSGVAAVRYEMRPTGGGSWTTVSTSTSGPFDGSWNTTGLSTGDYDLRPVITDGAGNAFVGATVTVHVDATAPTVALADPGPALFGTVTLNATVTGNGATQVTFLASPAGANSWKQIGVDTTSPWSAAFDTTSVTDGLYDLRAVVTDSVGNTSQDTRTNIRIDNTAPVLVSSTPADGSTVSSASSIELVTNEPATPTNVILDGAGTVTPVVSGTHILYNTGALASGLHTLTGTLSDASGKSSAFRVSFTVFTPSSGATPPPVEGGTSQSASTSVTSADGFATVTVPAGAWAPNGKDWIVIRIETTRAPSLANGYAPGSEVVNVTAFWALSGQPVHHFDKPIEILLRASGKGLVPATFESGAWRGLRRMPSSVLPDGWQDGFTADSAGFLLRTLHLSEFTVLRDVQAPSAPSNVLGFLIGGHLTLTWTPGADNSGTYDYIRVLANSVGVGDFGVDRTSGDVGAWTTSDSRSFTLKETDVAGNTSPATAALKHVPPLFGKTLDAAQSALEAAGLKLGNVTQGGVGKPGTVTGPTNLVLAAPGSAIDLTVAPGTTGFTKLVFRVVATKRLKATKSRALAARILLTRKARVAAVLYSPRRLRLSTWGFSMKAGRTIVKLRFPAQVRQPGVYSIRWTASAGRDSVTTTIRVRLFSGVSHRGTAQVVVAGSAVTPKLTLGSKTTKIVKTTGEDSTFDAAGAGSNGVQVMVVDVDQFGVSFVRDLHTVFPSLRMVALSRSPKTLAKASKAGATIALPRSIPNSVLAAVVSRLLSMR
jgi:Bacterial Ig domain